MCLVVIQPNGLKLITSDDLEARAERTEQWLYVKDKVMVLHILVNISENIKKPTRCCDTIKKLMHVLT